MSRRSWGLVAALVVLAAVGLVVVVLLARDAANEASGQETTTSTAGLAAAGEEGIIVAVDARGRLVVLDASTGAVLRVALTGIDVSDASRVDVTLTPDRDTAFVSGAAGRILRVPVEGGAAEAIATGEHAEVSPDGATLAYATAGSVVLRDLSTGGERRLPVRREPGFEQVDDISWMVDSRTLAFVAGPVVTEVFMVDTATAATLDDARVLTAGERGSGAAWGPVAALDERHLAVVETCCEDAGVGDHSRLLRVDRATGDVDGRLVPGDDVRARVIDADADGALVYVTTTGRARRTLWRWDGGDRPVRMRGGILAAAW